MRYSNRSIIDMIKSELLKHGYNATFVLSTGVRSPKLLDLRVIINDTEQKDEKEYFELTKQPNLEFWKENINYTTVFRVSKEWNASGTIFVYTTSSNLISASNRYVRINCYTGKKAKLDGTEMRMQINSDKTFIIQRLKEKPKNTDCVVFLDKKGMAHIGRVVNVGKLGCKIVKATCISKGSSPHSIATNSMDDIHKVHYNNIFHILSGI